MFSFLSDVRVHRIAAAVAAVLLVVQAQVSTGGAGFGLDVNTTQTIVGILTFLVTAARVVADGQTLAFVKALFVRSAAPTDPPASPPVAQ